MSDRVEIPVDKFERERLRDEFAMAAMSGDWAAQDEVIGEFENDLPDDAFAERAATYYRMADAMLAERERSK